MRLYRMRVGYNEWEGDHPKEHNVWVLVFKGNPRDAACQKAEWTRRLFDRDYVSYYAYYNPVNWKALFKTVWI